MLTLARDRFQESIWSENHESLHAKTHYAFEKYAILEIEQKCRLQASYDPR